MPPEEKPHDLHDFMNQLTNDMSAEYERIQKRTTEDPGTAGDQGEENWAELLRGWLPRTYEVVTKGRIISQDGETSPQIDVLVLKNSYPKKLLNKKHYLAAGVAAAFECKNTLKSSHITEAMKNSVKIKKLYPKRTGTPYKELHSRIVYGLLAHSHSWHSDNSIIEDRIDKLLFDSDREYVKNPRQGLDILCVANLSSWSSTKMALMGPFDPNRSSGLAAHFGKTGKVITSYNRQRELNQSMQSVTPIGRLISYLSQRIAWEDTSLRDIADYYRAVNIAGGGGAYREWPISIYSDKVSSLILTSKLQRGPYFSWDEWNMDYF